MNSQEFLKEVLNSEICPSNFEIIYKSFLKYQKAAIDTLNEFHRVCEENKIQYQLAYGSLLGAIRDNGQIPWDYDVDVFVPFEEKDRLITSLKRDLDDKYYFYCPEVDSKCRHFVMRLAPKKYRTEAIHVDVFYMIGGPKNVEECIDLKQKIASLLNIRFSKLVVAKEEAMGINKKFFKLILNKIKVHSEKLDNVEKQFYDLCSTHPVYNSDYCIPTDKFGMTTIYDSKMWNTYLISTTTGIYRVPCNYDEILTSIYGNWHQYLPLKSRIKEVTKSYKRLKYFDDNF